MSLKTQRPLIDSAKLPLIRNCCQPLVRFSLTFSSHVLLLFYIFFRSSCSSFPSLLLYPARLVDYDTPHHAISNQEKQRKKGEKDLLVGFSIFRSGSETYALSRRTMNSNPSDDISVTYFDGTDDGILRWRVTSFICQYEKRNGQSLA